MDETEVKARLKRFPAYDLLGVELVSAGDGQVELSMDCDQRHSNLDGAVHGGMVAFLADTAMGLAVRSQIDPSWPNKTLSLSMDYVRSARAGERLTAAARVETGSRRFRWATVSVTSPAGIVALGRSLNLVEPPS